MRCVLMGWAGIGLLLSSGTTLLWAETPDDRRVEEQARAALGPTEQERRILSTQSRVVIDGGVWTNYRLTDFNEDDNDENLRDATAYTQTFDYRLWARGVLRPAWDNPQGRSHSVYFRWKDQYIWRHPSETSGGDDHDGPHIDYAYATLDFRPIVLHGGRRYYSVGQGIAYSDVHDGAEIEWHGTDWSARTFLSHTKPHDDNLDLSVPGSDKSSRAFWGTQINYIGIKNHGLYVFSVVERDRSEETQIDPNQDYAYDATYLGFGAEGTLLPRVHYWAEVIGSVGHSFVSGGTDRNTVRAMAIDVGATYDTPLPTHPVLYGEHAYGSGDADRINVTDTINGNAGGDDTNFLYFGYLPMGYALSPRLSNVHMLKLGASATPLTKWKAFRHLSVSVDWYRFLKDEAAGGIFDLDAGSNDRDVGYEIDVTLRWQILSDLTCNVEYGHFEPGDAYQLSANHPSDYFSLSVTTTF